MNYVLSPRGERRAQVIETHIAPGGSPGPEPWSHSGELVIATVLEGSVEFRFERAHHGAAGRRHVSYSPAEPHSWRNPDGERRPSRCSSKCRRSTDEAAPASGGPRFTGSLRVSSAPDEDVLAHPQTARRLQVAHHPGLRLGLRPDGPQPHRAAHHPAHINNALSGGETGLLVTYSLALLGVALVRFIVGVGRRLATGKVSLGIEYDLRNRMWAHLLRQPFGYFDRWPTGQLMSRAMSDIQNVRMFLGYGLVFFATNIVMIVAIAVHPLRPGLAAGAALPGVPAVPAARDDPLQPRACNPILRDVQQKIADVTAAAEENVVGSRIVRIFAREDDELRQVQRPQLQGVRGKRRRGPRARGLHPAHRLHPQPRRRRSCCTTAGGR